MFSRLVGFLEALGGDGQSFQAGRTSK